MLNRIRLSLPTLPAMRESAILEERAIIRRALLATGWSIKYAAIQLDVGISTLQKSLAARHPELDAERIAYLATLTTVERQRPRGPISEKRARRAA